MHHGRKAQSERNRGPTGRKLDHSNVQKATEEAEQNLLQPKPCGCPNASSGACRTCRVRPCLNQPEQIQDFLLRPGEELSATEDPGKSQTSAKYDSKTQPGWSMDTDSKRPGLLHDPQGSGHRPPPGANTRGENYQSPDQGVSSPNVPGTPAGTPIYPGCLQDQGSKQAAHQKRDCHLPGVRPQTNQPRHLGQIHHCPPYPRATQVPKLSDVRAPLLTMHTTATLRNVQPKAFHRYMPNQIQKWGKNKGKMSQLQRQSPCLESAVPQKAGEDKGCPTTHQPTSTSTNNHKAAKPTPKKQTKSGHHQNASAGGSTAQTGADSAPTSSPQAESQKQKMGNCTAASQNSQATTLSNHKAGCSSSCTCSTTSSPSWTCSTTSSPSHTCSTSTHPNNIRGSSPKNAHGICRLSRWDAWHSARPSQSATESEHSNQTGEGGFQTHSNSCSSPTHNSSCASQATNHTSGCNSSPSASDGESQHFHTQEAHNPLRRFIQPHQSLISDGSQFISRLPCLPSPQRETLKILQWNVNSFARKQAMLTATVKAEDFDIILLQETLQKEQHNPKLSGYTTYKLSSNEHTRGLLTFIKNSIPSAAIQNPIHCGENVEVLAVTVQLLHNSLCIYNIYKQHQGALELDELFASTSNHQTFIGGDFNAHHPILHSP